MLIAQLYRQDTGMDSDEEINDIENGHLKGLQEKAKKAEKVLKRSWDVYTVQRVGPKQQKIPKEQLIGQNN